MPACSALMQQVKPDLAWEPHYGGMLRHAYARSRRLITRRSQVQILPPLLREALADSADYECAVDLGGGGRARTARRDDSVTLA
jgi:hypothetical protein